MGDASTLLWRNALVNDCAAIVGGEHFATFPVRAEEAHCLLMHGPNCLFYGQLELFDVPDIRVSTCPSDLWNA